ncbi:MAG: hypothetical protein IPK50_08040 [Fibrobacterota bacterium]|nr:hypothetical protein [Fibrobacterota bacterium]QQS06837.1 MAG: hypothetical protein IPK50_08040 [Fibrobacterota bacterium]
MCTIGIYQNIYDVSSATYDGWSISLVLLPIALLLTGGAFFAHRTGDLVPVRWVLYALGIFGWSLFLASAAINLDNSHAFPKKHLQQKYSLVEGTVFDFVPDSSNARMVESWSVRDRGTVHSYRYKAGPMAKGYSKTHSVGGTVQNGQQVRIHEIEGKIAGLDVCTTPPEFLHAPPKEP